LLIVAFATSLVYISDKLKHNDKLVIKSLSSFSKALWRTDSNLTSSTLINPKPQSAFFVDKNRSDANNFIVENTNQKDRIFVGLKRHDKVFVNDVVSYFLTNRLPATKWHHFDPGLQTSEHIQHEVISDLEKIKPSYIWLESTWEAVMEPNESVNSSGVLILDKYIGEKYHKVKEFGLIEIWEINQ